MFMDKKSNTNRFALHGRWIFRTNWREIIESITEKYLIKILNVNIFKEKNYEKRKNSLSINR